MMVDTSLNLSNALFFKYNASTNLTERIIANSKGEVITYAELNSGGDLRNIFVSKFNPLNEPIREIQIKYPAGSNYQKGGWKPIGLKDKYISLVNNYNVAGDTHFQLSQIPDDVEMNDCFGTDTSVIKIEPYPLTEVSHPFVSIVRSIPLQVKDLGAIVSDFPLVSTPDCVIKSSCDSLSVSGQDTICKMNKTYRFVAHKNPECNKHVLWQIDSSAIQSQEQINDTTIHSIQKKLDGYLYASINSCSFLRDSIKIDVLSSPDAIDIGRDTILCAGDQLILNAKSGFKNYVWQDGSADSVFTVTQPGNYFVTAKDYCNNIYSDTIQITYQQPTDINIGNDTSICNNEFLLLNAGDNFTNYAWNTGETTQSISVNSIGEYSVYATNSYGCISRDTVKILNVFPAPVMALKKQNVLCLGQK